MKPAELDEGGVPSDRLQASLRRAHAILQFTTADGNVDYTQFDNAVIAEIFYALFDCVCDANTAAEEMLAELAAARSRPRAVNRG